jgi:hypothetical protein
MSRQINNTFGRSLAAASAALLIHIGSAAAAAPQTDFQSQVSAVLAGTSATHAALRADSARDDASGDAQQFARQLLLGWSTSHPARAASATESQSASAADVSQDDSSAQADIQTTVQHFLRGE